MEFKVSSVFSKLNDAYESIKPIFRLIVLLGSSRSGKSYAIMQLFVLILLAKKNYKITVWRNTRVNAVATILEDFRSVIASSPYLFAKFIYNKKDATFICKTNGSIIHFMGTDDLSKVLGMRQDISFFNEISHFSHEVYLQIAQRTNDKIFADYNPSAVTILDRYKQREDTIWMRSTFMDNPFLTEGIINELRGRNPFEWGTTTVSDDGTKLLNKENGKEINDNNKPPPNELNIKNGTSDYFMWLVYGLGIGSERPNKIFKEWEVCSNDFYERLEYESYIGLDFGVSSPTALVEVKFDGDRTFYVKEALYLPSSKMGMPIYEYILGKGIVNESILIVADSAKKSMVDDLVNGGLLAVGALKGAGSVARNIMQVQSFKIIYTESSENLVTEYDDYSYKLDKKTNESTDDVEDKNNDHLINALQYVIGYLINYLSINYGKGK